MEAEKVREEKNKIYNKLVEDFEATITAIDDAIKGLEEAKAGASSLAQLRRVQSLLALSGDDTPALKRARRAIAGFLEQPNEELMKSYTASTKPKVYEFKSGNVIELLKQLKVKFQDDLKDAHNEETASVNAYTLEANSRDSALKACKDQHDALSKALPDVQTALTDADAKLKDTKNDHTEDSKSLESTSKECNLKKMEFDERAKVREQEIKALEKAVEILAKVTGAPTEPPEVPGPPPSPVGASEGAENATEPVALLQIGSDDPRADARARALAFLKARLKLHHSRRLMMVAEALADGPFDKIVGMIQQLIQELMAQQTDEDEHKLWCDKELSTSNATKVEKEENIEEVSAKIEELKAKLVQLAEEVKEANEMVSKIDSHVQEATAIRKEASKANKEAIAESQKAQDAVTQAIAILEAHYKESGMIKKEPWEFLQAPVELPEQPSTWDAAYTGVADPSAQPGGIITVLEEISADFAKMEADTKANEETDKKLFEDDMAECAIEKARRSKESEMKTQKKQQGEDKVDEMEKVKKHNEKELYAIEKYIKELQPACVEGDSTYEDRKAARDEEIKGLREAQAILEGAYESQGSAFLQARGRGKGRR